MRLCQFKNLFGEVGTGIHAIRVFDIAVIDLIMTMIGAYFMSKKWEVSYWKVFAGLMVLGIFLHWLFCVPTTLNKLLNLV